MNQPCPQSNTLAPAHGEVMAAGPQPNEDPIVTATPRWYIRVLVVLTMYGELSAARIPAEFAPVRTRMQQEWTFHGGFVCPFTIFLDSLLILY